MLFVCGAITPSHWIQLALLGISTSFMVMLNNSNSLIRVFSRLVSCSFLTLIIMLPSLLDSLSGCVVQLLFILMLLFLFKAYQDRQSMGIVFYAFVCIGGISTQFIQILFFIPFIWIMLFTSLQAGSARVLVASLLGLLLPYWFWACYSIYNESYGLIIDHVLSIASIDYSFEILLQPARLLTLILTTTLGVTGVVYFFSAGYKNNIHTRMLYNVLITLFLVSIIFIILQPQHSDYLIRIAIICASPLIAHFFTFTNTWLTNIAFYGTMIAIFSITILNTWIF